MKIAYFLDIPRGVGGAGNLLLQQAILMSELYEVIVVIPADAEGNYNHEYARRCEQYHIFYVSMEYSTANNFSLIDYTAAMDSAVYIEEFAKKEKITFFHSVQLNIAVEYIARKLKIPHLMDIYQLQEEEFRICPGDIYPHYHLCDSLLYSNRWSSHLGIASRCVRPVAILDSIKQKSTEKKENVNILMLGAVCIRKNQLTAIKAVEQCIDYGKIKLHIAGEFVGDYAELCKEYVRKHGLEQNVVFYGFVSDIIPLLEDCDCLLCSSIDESFPSSIVEALTYGLTIISTPVAGVPELFIDKKNSFISSDFSEKSIRASILECLHYYESGRICEIRKNAEKTWKDNFGRELVKNQINLYYKKIVKDGFFGDIQPFLEVEADIKRTEKLLFGMNGDAEKYLYKRSLYYTFIRKEMCDGTIYIWGAGKLGKISFEILRRICPDLEIKAFIDTNRSGSYCGIPVIRPKDTPIEKDNFYSISFLQGRTEAVRYLEDNGLVLNRQIWYMP